MISGDAQSGSKPNSAVYEDIGPQEVKNVAKPIQPTPLDTRYAWGWKTNANSS